jgi:hypothetical protein
MKIFQSNCLNSSIKIDVKLIYFENLDNIQHKLCRKKMKISNEIRLLYNKENNILFLVQSKKT